MDAADLTTHSIKIPINFLSSAFLPIEYYGQLMKRWSLADQTLTCAGRVNTSFMHNVL